MYTHIYVVPCICKYVQSVCMYVHAHVILVIVNHEPKEIYMKFERKLLDSLPADQPDFIKLLERKEIIGEKNKKKMNAPNQTRAGCAGCVLQEIDASTFCDEKFYKLLSVMKEYGHGMETLVLEIEAYLDPGMY